MNVAEQYAQFLNLVEGVTTLVASATYPHARFLGWLHVADGMINRRHMIAEGRSEITVTSPGATDFLWNIPRDALNRQVLSVQWIDSDGNVGEPLERIDEERVSRDFGKLANPAGSRGPVAWWPSLTPGKFGVGWPPEESGSWLVTYNKLPARLTRLVVVDSSARQINVTNGQAAFTFTSGKRPAVGTIAVNDEIGVGTNEPPPTDWYRVATLTDSGGNLTGGTFDREYEGATATNTGFAAAQVSDLELASPEHARAMASVYYAASLAIQKSDAELAKVYMEEFKGHSGSAPSRRNQGRPSGAEAEAIAARVRWNRRAV